jgi:hypothetical protein
VDLTRALEERARTIRDPADLDRLIKEGGYVVAFEVARKNRHKPVLVALADRLMGTRTDLFFPAVKAALRLGQGRVRVRAAVFAKDRSTNAGLTRIERTLLSVDDRREFRPLIARWLRAEKDPHVARRLMWARVHSTPDRSPDRLESILDVLARFDLPRTRKDAMRALSYCMHSSRRERVHAFLATLSKVDRRAFRAIERYAK